MSNRGIAMKSLYTIFALLVLTSTSVWAQKTYQSTEDSKVVVKGTSTVHDWESKVEEFSVEITIDESDNESLSIQSLKFIAEAKSVKEGKRIMDNKTKDALKAKDFPQITFTMSELGEVTAESVAVKGTLTIAGVSNEVELTASYSTGNLLTINGSYPLLMSDYGIDPPTAMMGSLKTGDEVTLEFELTLTEK